LHSETHVGASKNPRAKGKGWGLQYIRPWVGGSIGGQKEREGGTGKKTPTPVGGFSSSHGVRSTMAKKKNGGRKTPGKKPGGLRRSGVNRKPTGPGCDKVAKENEKKKKKSNGATQSQKHGEK